METEEEETTPKAAPARAAADAGAAAKRLGLRETGRAGWYNLGREEGGTKAAEEEQDSQLFDMLDQL